MEKFPAFLILSFSLAAATASSASVTLQFSSPTFGMATNWADSSGVGGSRLVWGIVIDTAGNGFDSHFFQGVNFATAGGQSLLTPEGNASDDYLWLSSNLMATPNATYDGMVPGNNAITNITSIGYNSAGVNAGDAFAIVWFDRTSFSGISNYGDAFGIFTDSSFIIPPDSYTVSFAPLFAGADSLKLMTGSLVPEPSTALLGLLGIAGLIRRRR